ncbi:MAG: hypothetical protein QXO84_01845 [Candidatus Aenigmatarchaeota archaeon]
MSRELFNVKAERILLMFIVFCLFLKVNESADFISIMNSSLVPYNFYYIQTSAELSKGILFTNSTGSEENKQYPLIAGSWANNAIWNYNKSSGKTEYWVFVYVMGVELDLCHNAKNHLCSTQNCSGPNNYLIDIKNARWSISLQNDLENPSLADSISFSLQPEKFATKIGSPTTIYFRYWLDVPPNSSAASYNTTYQITSVVSGYEC